MHELQLHQVLKEHPELIEEGLQFLDQEVLIKERLRCDLLFKDKNELKVFVEVKKTARRSSIVQIEQYELLGMDKSARYILVALDSKPGLPEIATRRGFEFKLIDKEKLLEIQPKWEESLILQSNKSTNDEKIDREFFLKGIQEKVRKKFANCYYDVYQDGKNKRKGIFIPSKDEDKFLIDFSSEVKDGIRCGFIVDFVKPSSDRRISFRKMLEDINKNNEISIVLETPVMKGSGTSNKNLIKRNITSWCKIGEHRRMGIYCIYRFPKPLYDWTDIDSLCQEMSLAVLTFIERMNSLLKRYYIEL